MPEDIDLFVEELKTAKFIPCNQSQAAYFKLNHPQTLDSDGIRLVDFTI